jgi:predicted CxxxxCH...CXXCH cytochrome family protein
MVTLRIRLFINVLFSTPVLLGAFITANIGGCTSDETVVRESMYHPEGWNSVDHPDFHGDYGLANGIQSCPQCHGSDWAGGLAERSCRDCHFDGQDNCVACHGGLENNTGAPPYGLHGETDDDVLAVGAHEAHIEGDDFSDGVECLSCHVVPDMPWDSSHFDFDITLGSGVTDSIAEVAFGGIAGGGAWDRDAGTCAYVYCHGNFPGGFFTNSPSWNIEDDVLCGSCHDAGANPGFIDRLHSSHWIAGIRCERCHAATVNAQLEIIGKSVHIDGQKTIEFSESGTYTEGSCSGLDAGGCHEPRVWH